MNKQNTDTGSKGSGSRFTAYRFLHRKHGDFGWTCELGLTAYHDEKSASQLIKQWSERDGREWKYEVCTEGSIDHPAAQQPAPETPEKRAWRESMAQAAKIQREGPNGNPWSPIKPAPGERDETWTDMEQAPETSAAEHLIRTPSDLRYARLQAELERVKGQLDYARKMPAQLSAQLTRAEQQRDELLAALKETLAAFGRCRQTGDWKALNDWNLWNGVGAAIGRAEHASVEKEGK